jgi:hypothetical protein
VLVEELRSKLTAVMNSDRQLTLADLRRGIEAGEIVPYYQPHSWSPRSRFPPISSSV